MTDTGSQHFGNHTRWLPLFHFFALPVTLFYALYQIKVVVANPTTDSILFALFTLAVATAVLVSRLMANTVQDRVKVVGSLTRKHGFEREYVARTFARNKHAFGSNAQTFVTKIETDSRSRRCDARQRNICLAQFGANDIADKKCVDVFIDINVNRQIRAGETAVRL